MQHEAEAAKAAARAMVAAEKKIAKEEAKELATKAREAAEETKKAAAQARDAAKGAPAEEAARSNESARKATGHEAQADRAARDLEAAAGDIAAEAGGAIKHAPPRSVGGHTLQVRGNWIVRCSDTCLEVGASIAARSRKLADELASTPALTARAEELRPRLNAAASRASAAGERAEREIAAASAADRVRTEARFLDEAALIEMDVQALEHQVLLEAVPRGSMGKVWGDIVQQNIKIRIANARGYAASGGTVSTALDASLRRLGREADQLAETATRLERHPRAFSKSVSEIENDLATRWSKLDEAMEGIEREERARADVRTMGGTMLGGSDAEVGRALSIPAGNKIPDIATDLGGGRLLLAESKGSDIAGAFKQFESALDSSGAAAFTSFELRIYLKADRWEQLLRTSEVGGMPASRRGNAWILSGPRGHTVYLYPG
jgi:hypothetical protein